MEKIRLAIAGWLFALCILLVKKDVFNRPRAVFLIRRIAYFIGGHGKPMPLFLWVYRYSCVHCYTQKMTANQNGGFQPTMIFELCRHCKKLRDHGLLSVTREAWN